MTLLKRALCTAALVVVSAAIGCSLKNDKARVAGAGVQPDASEQVIRAQVGEGASLAEDAKAAVMAFHDNNGVFPAGNSSAGLVSAASIHGLYVSSLDVQVGKIEVVFGTPKADPAIYGTTLVFSPYSDTGSTKWSCNSGAGSTVAIKYRPLTCQR